MALGKGVRQLRNQTPSVLAMVGLSELGEGTGPALLRAAAQERALSRAAFQIFAQTDEEALLRVALAVASSLVQVDVAAIFLRSGNNGDAPRCRAIWSEAGMRRSPPEASPWDALATDVLRRQAPCRRRSWLSPGGELCASALAVPLSVEGEALGVLIAGRHKSSRFRDDHVALLSVVGESLALALRRLRMPLEFVSMASHELRTPLTALQGFTELMLSREVSPSVQREWLGLVNQEAVRLGGIIEEMLDVTRIESGQVRLKLASVCLGDVVSRIARLLDSDGRRVRLQVEGVPAVMADGDRLAQVISNLLRNALDYSPSEQPVEVEAASRCLAQECETAEAVDAASPAGAKHRCRPAVSVAVRDWGVGLTPEELSRSFQSFYRTEASRELLPGGTGLGLPIAKAIVERHQGRLWAHSRPGRGSTFGFCLPAQAPASTNGAT